MANSSTDRTRKPRAAEKRFYTVAEVAAELGYSTKTIRRWIADGRLFVSRPGGKPGAHIRISATHFADFRRRFAQTVSPGVEGMGLRGTV